MPGKKCKEWQLLWIWSLYLMWTVSWIEDMNTGHWTLNIEHWTWWTNQFRPVSFDFWWKYDERGLIEFLNEKDGKKKSSYIKLSEDCSVINIMLPHGLILPWQEGADPLVENAHLRKGMVRNFFRILKLFLVTSTHNIIHTALQRSAVTRVNRIIRFLALLIFRQNSNKIDIGAGLVSLFVSKSNFWEAAAHWVVLKL